MAKAKKTATDTTAIISFKGFDQELSCRNFKFEIGKTYTVTGKVKACENGFHACEHPFDVWSYYEPATSRFAVVEQSGDLARHEGDSKIASASITIKAELSLPEFVSRGVEYILSKVVSTKVESNTGYQSAATNTGDRSAATNTGYQSAATNTGDQSAATNTGYRSAATNTGDQSAATNTGNRSAATNTGDQSAATNTGNQSAATNTGDQSAATVEGKHSVAIASGIEGRAKASATGAIVLVYRDPDDEWAIKHIFAAKVGERGIKADTWYALNADGEPVEAAQ